MRWLFPASCLFFIVASGDSPAQSQTLPKLWGLRPVGGPPGEGDDVGPPIEIQVQRYRETNATLGFTGVSWETALPEDPGEASPVYDFSAIEKNPFFFPDLENIAGIDLHCEWAETLKSGDPDRYHRLATDFVTSLVRYSNGLGVRFFHASGNEFNLLARTDWPMLYVDRLRIIYPAMKGVSNDNILLAGNLSAGVEEPIQRLYDAGFKDYFDVMDIHCYSNHPRTGVSIEQVMTTHRTMERNGDGHKLIFLSEGWGPGRSLPGVERQRPNDPISGAEIQGMRDFVVNGFRNLNRPKPGFDPVWILGAIFFTLNDNMGGTYWRERAVPVKDRDGSIVGYNLDGYFFSDWDALAPAFYNGGIIDFYGNPKGNILHDFPPKLPLLTFRGWVVGAHGETQEAIPESERLPQRLLAGRAAPVELILENKGNIPIDIADVRLALKGKDIPSMAIQPDVQDLVTVPEVAGLMVRADGPVTSGELAAGERAGRRFTVLFPESSGGKTFTLLGECVHKWNGKEYYTDCWVPVETVPSLEVSLRPERVFVTTSNREASLWISAVNNTDASLEAVITGKYPDGIRATLGEPSWVIPGGETARREVRLTSVSLLPAGRYPVSLWIDDRELSAVMDLAIDVPRVRAAIQIDGVLAEWDHGSSVRFVRPPPEVEGEQELFDPADLLAKAFFLWDEEAFYVGIDVTDDVFWQEHSGMDVWRGDSVQLGFDTRLNALPGVEGYDQDDYEYTLAKTEEGMVAARYHGPREKGPGIIGGIRFTAATSEEGTVYEIAVPWSELSPFQPAENKRFGVSLLVNDNDGYGRKYCEWAGGIGAWKEPGKFLPLRLVREAR